MARAGQARPLLLATPTKLELSGIYCSPDRGGVHRAWLRAISACVLLGSSPVRNPLNRASSHAKLSGDLMEAGASRSRQSVADSLFHLGGCTRAAEGFATLGAARL